MALHLAVIPACRPMSLNLRYRSGRQHHQTRPGTTILAAAKPEANSDDFVANNEDFFRALPLYTGGTGFFASK